MRHERAVELLPAFVSGSLGPDRRRALERHLAGCEDCRRELELERRLASAVATTSAAADPRSDLLATTLARIDEYEGQRERSTASAGASRGSWADRMREGWQRFWRPLPPPARVLIAVQLVLVMTLGAGLVLRREGGELRTLSGPTGAQAVAGKGRLQVLFRGEATVQQVAEAVRAVGGSIVSGPSAAGYYTVEVTVGDEDPSGDLAAVARKLAARTEVVRLASPEAP